jgi:predicted Na+-dependent transporter
VRDLLGDRIRLLTLGGVVGPILFSVVVIVSAALRVDYSHIANFISELGATGTPHAGLMNYAGFLPGGLMLAAFGVALAKALPQRHATILAVILVTLFGGSGGVRHRFLRSGLPPSRRLSREPRPQWNCANRLSLSHSWRRHSRHGNINVLGRFTEVALPPVLLTFVIAAALGWGLARVTGLVAADRRAVTIEVAFQNVALAVGMAVAFFPSLAGVAITAILWGTTHLTLGFALAAVWMRVPIAEGSSVAS